MKTSSSSKATEELFKCSTRSSSTKDRVLDTENLAHRKYPMCAMMRGILKIAAFSKVTHSGIKLNLTRNKIMTAIELRACGILGSS